MTARTNADDKGLAIPSGCSDRAVGPHSFICDFVLECNLSSRVPHSTIRELA